MCLQLLKVSFVINRRIYIYIIFKILGSKYWSISVKHEKQNLRPNRKLRYRNKSVMYLVFYAYLYFLTSIDSSLIWSQAKMSKHDLKFIISGKIKIQWQLMNIPVNHLSTILPYEIIICLWFTTCKNALNHFLTSMSFD